VPGDLDGLRALVGAGALDYALVAGAFHFINRIADLLGVDSEALPAPLRRFEALRRATVALGARVLRARVDLRPRRDDSNYEREVAALGALVGPDDRMVAARTLEPLRSRPGVVEVLRLAIEERDRRSSLDRATLARVHGIVEGALPAAREDAEGIHVRPSDPVETFAFVGTRYAARTTREMIERLRAAGLDDLAILDLAIAVADANQWARMHRLLGLPAALFSLARP
jgi:hypothetical protein